MKPFFLWCLTLLLTLTTPQTLAFSDVDRHMYQSGISYVQEQGIIQGYEDGTFRPNESVNRAELVKMVVEAQGTKKLESRYNTPCFSDVEVGEWYTPYLCYAKEQGILQGYLDGTVRPATPVSFVEATKILAEGFELASTGNYNEWFRGYVEAAAQQELLPLGILSFEGHLTRGQMADMTARFVVFQKEQTKGLQKFLGTTKNKRTTYETIKEGRMPVAAMLVKTVEEKNTTQKTGVQDPIEEQLYTVVRVVDGDTIIVSIDGKEERVRIIGIDTPETVHPEKSVECFGKEASQYAKSVLENKKVRLEQDLTQDNRDKYERLLRHVFLENGMNFSLEMLRSGYAHEYTYRVPYIYQTAYKEAAATAKQNKKGLWADDACLKPKEEPKKEEVVVPVTPIPPVMTAPVEQPASSAGVVKLSTSNICHEPGTTYYTRTKNYRAFTTIEECLNAGGRYPKR